MSFAADGLIYADIPSTRTETLEPSARRTFVGPLLFFIPVLLSGASYVCGGVPIITDLSFLLLTALCIIFLLGEFHMFSRREGVGGILIYGGVLVWFCHDYIYNWLGINFNSPHLLGTAEIVAKAAFYHCLFIDIMLIVLNIPMLRWIEKFIVAVPEPASESMYLSIMLITAAVGYSPFFIFLRTAPWEGLWNVLILRGDLLQWTTGRSLIGHAANLNYNWGGYIVQIINIGQVSGILGAAYAIMVAKTFPGKLIGWFNWLFWAEFTYPALRRGDLAFMVLPVVGFLYYKYQIQTRTYLSRIGWRSYLAAGIVGFGLFAVVQYESARRSNASLDLLAARGNTMFSDPLKAWTIFPDRTGGFFDDKFPGASAVMPIPQTLYWLLVDPVPRALWTTKPIDPFEIYFNDLLSGEHMGATGTTESRGAVGYWYFRYGPCGVIEGAIIYGFLMGVSERALRRAGARVFGLIFAMAFAVFMFRAYRDLWFHALDPVLVAGVFLYILIRLTGAARPQQVPVYNT